MSLRKAWLVLILCGTSTGCEKPLDTNRTVEPYASFGAAIYREACQRVAYIGQLEQKRDGVIKTVDVSGDYGRAVCVDGRPPDANAPPKLPALVKERPGVVAEVDAILPSVDPRADHPSQDFLQELQDFLVGLAPLADDGTMQRAISSLGDTLGVMHDDADFAPAFARLAVRAGYRPPTASALLRTVIEYDGIDDFIGKALALVAPGGTAENEWKQLLTATSLELRSVQPLANPGDGNRTLKLAIDLLKSTNPELGGGPTAVPKPLVARDYRGLAQVSAPTGTLATPFVDMNHDGLADADASGHFVDAKGQPLQVPTPFPEHGVADSAKRDAAGRALGADGKPLYNYFDLDGTVFGGLARESLTLLDPKKDTAFGLLWGAATLLGPRAPQTKAYDALGSLSYSGYDTSQSALLDLVHAFTQIIGDPNVDQTLQLVAQLLAPANESRTARLIGAMLDASDRGKLHPEAAVSPTSDLYDRLVPVLLRIVRVDDDDRAAGRKGLVQDLLDALQDPRAKAFAPMVGRLMLARNQIDFNHTNGPDYPLTSNLDALDVVDRSQPDADYNRSLLQRIAHVIHDSNGLKFCNKDHASVIGIGDYAPCDLFEIDDLALFYVLNMASDNVRRDSRSTTAPKASFCAQIKPAAVRITAPLVLATGVAGITGFNCFSTPAALNRALFLRNDEKSNFLQSTTDDLLCKDGDRFIDVHDKSLFAWETSLIPNPAGPGHNGDTFYDAVRPIIDAFAKHDECLQKDGTGVCIQAQNAAKIFVDIFALLHEHWTSPQGSYFGHHYQATDVNAPRFAYADSVVSYEPLLAEVLGQADLIPAVTDFVPLLSSLSVNDADGQPLVARDAVLKSAKYLFDPAFTPAAVAYRDGRTSAVQSDGHTPVVRATPYYILADAYVHKRAALAAAAMPAQADKWRAATTALVDQLLTVDHDAKAGTFAFHNRHFHGLSLVLVDFLRARVAAHVAAKDFDHWAHQELTADVAEKVSGPVFAALGDFMARVEGDGDARDQLYRLVQYLVDEAQHNDAFVTALTSLADQVQMFLDDPDLVPVAHVIGAAMDPQKGAVDAELTLLKRAHELDTNKMLLAILRNLYRTDAMGAYRISNLSDILSEVNRAVPGHGGDLDGGDYRSILGELRDFFVDENRGFIRFVNIVKARGSNR